MKYLRWYDSRGNLMGKLVFTPTGMNKLSVFRQKSRLASPYFEQFILYDKTLFSVDFARAVLRPSKQLRFFQIFSDKFSFFTNKTLVPNDPSGYCIGQ